jgi:hypothetical protein
LLADPVKLPLLSVDLYVLVQLYLLARLLRLFDGELRATTTIIEQDRRRVRSQLDKFVFTQFLIGAPQDWMIRLSLRATVELSFVVGPLVLVVGFLVRFLPYHSRLVTMVDVMMVTLEMSLLTLMWPKISLNRRQSLWLVGGVSLFAVYVSGIAIMSMALSTIIPAVLPTVIGLDNWVLRLQRLSLLNEQLVEQDEDKLSKLHHTLILRDRDLREARLSFADLRKADLRRANLRYSHLDSTNLRGVDLREADLRGASLFGTDLSRADLRGADLHNVILFDTNLSSADLTGAVGLPGELDHVCGDAKTQLPGSVRIRPGRVPRLAYRVTGTSDARWLEYRSAEASASRAIGIAHRAARPRPEPISNDG